MISAVTESKPDQLIQFGDHEVVKLRAAGRQSGNGAERLEGEQRMDLQLKGKKAIVTGATKGIGLAIAETLAGEGCDIAVCARDGALVETTVADLSTRGVQAHGASADVTDGDSFRQWIEQAAEQLGGLDIMVANVSALAGASDEAAWRAGLETDVLGTVRAVEAGLPFLEKSDCGSIVAIASTAALENFFGVRAYNAIKAAVIAYMSALASTVASQGIRANTVSPGTIYFEGGVWDQRRQEMPKIYEAALAKNPTGHMGKPQDVANAVAFLASPAAKFVNGANLVVDGALTQRVQF